MSDERLSPEEWLREHTANGEARIRHTHSPGSALYGPTDLDFQLETARRENSRLKEQVVDLKGAVESAEEEIAMGDEEIALLKAERDALSERVAALSRTLNSVGRLLREVSTGAA